jgi:CBS-domain-containing membrane protein
MSFLVVFNGQFSPLVHPTNTSGRTIPIVQPSDNPEQIEEFEEVLRDFKDEAPKKALKKLEIYEQTSKKFEEDKKRFYAKDIMSSPVQLISKESPATEAEKLLKHKGFRHLPVVNDLNVIEGMISYFELSEILEGKSCKDIMAQKVIVCEEHTSINEIAIILLKEKLNALPIINHKKELVGIITLSDILKYVIESTSFLGRG